MADGKRRLGPGSNALEDNCVALAADGLNGAERRDGVYLAIIGALDNLEF